MNKSNIISIAILLISLFVINGLLAQVPQGFNYQGVARDADDKVISDDFISLRFSVVQGSSSGNVVYLETHQNVPTTPQGVFSVIVGGGVTNDVFQNVDWGAASYFLRVDMDINNGTDYERMGASQLLSVPYALHAGSAASGGHLSDGDSDPTNELQMLSNSKSGGVITLSISDGGSTDLDINDGDSDDSNELQDLVFSGNTLGISGRNSVVLPDQVNDADPDPNNEIQNLRLTGSQLSISGGNTINLPVSGGTGDNWGSQTIQSDATLSGDGTSANPLGVFGDLTDDQTLTLSGNSLSISGGNTVTIDDKVNDSDPDPSNELITNFTLSGNILTIEESSQARFVDLSPLAGGGASSLWSVSGNSVFYETGEVFVGNPTASGTNLSLSNTTYRINGVEGTEVTFNTEKLSFDPIGFTPSLGSADYRRNGFEIFSGSGLETRVTDAVFEMASGDNIAHLEPENLHFHTSSGDGMIYSNINIHGTSGNNQFNASPSQVSISDNNANTYVNSNSVIIERNGGNSVGLGLLSGATYRPTLFTNGADLSVLANDVGFNTNDPELEVHIAEKDAGGNYQLYLENDNNDWLLGAAENENNLRFRNLASVNFLFLDGDSYNFGAVSDKRAKKNIRNQPNVLDQMMALKVKQFEYLGSEQSTIGLIAQEVQQIFPSLISEHDVNQIDGAFSSTFEDGKILGLNYTQLTFLNMKAIQEQQEIIDDQKTEIADLKKLMLEMRKEIDELKD